MHQNIILQLDYSVESLLVTLKRGLLFRLLNYLKSFDGLIKKLNSSLPLEEVHFPLVNARFVIAKFKDVAIRFILIMSWIFYKYIEWYSEKYNESAISPVWDEWTQFQGLSGVGWELNQRKMGLFDWRFASLHRSNADLKSSSLQLVVNCWRCITETAWDWVRKTPNERRDLMKVVLLREKETF